MRALTTVTGFIAALLSRSSEYLGTSRFLYVVSLEHTPITTNIKCQIIYRNTDCANNNGLDGVQLYTGTGPPTGSTHQALDCAPSLIVAPNDHARLRRSSCGWTSLSTPRRRLQHGYEREMAKLSGYAAYTAAKGARRDMKSTYTRAPRELA